LRKKYSASAGYESLILSTTIGSCVIFLLVLGSSLHIIFRRLVLNQQYLTKESWPKNSGIAEVTKPSSEISINPQPLGFLPQYDL